MSEITTDKTIRSKMYSWIGKKGIVLTDEDRKEIKAIMEEYRSFAVSEIVRPEKPKIEKEWITWGENM